jgi:gluconate 2-dehydrogenase gamma chain
MNPTIGSRRLFLKETASGLTAAWLALHWTAVLEAHEHAKRSVANTSDAKLEFFSPPEAIEVEAMAAQIIPTTDSPGAREAGVIYFIDRALTTFDRERQSVYHDGFVLLQSRTKEIFPDAIAFSKLNSDQQIQLLTAIEKTEFFETVRVHTIMGFLADPGYGGNWNEIGWKLIGFESRPTFKPPFGYYDAEEQS